MVAKQIGQTADCCTIAYAVRIEIVRANNSVVT